MHSDKQFTGGGLTGGNGGGDTGLGGGDTGLGGGDTGLGGADGVMTTSSGVSATLSATATPTGTPIVRPTSATPPTPTATFCAVARPVNQVTAGETKLVAALVVTGPSIIRGVSSEARTL